MITTRLTTTTGKRIGFLRLSRVLQPLRSTWLDKDYVARKATRDRPRILKHRSLGAAHH